MVTVQIDEDTLVEMLVERVQYWKDNAEVVQLFRDMYTNYAESGVFEGMELNIMEIVDNDVVNYCSVIEEGDDGFDALLEFFNENGITDCSIELEEYGFGMIEAVDDEDKPTMFLVRMA